MEKSKIIDAHVHVFGKGTQGVRDLLEFQKRYGYGACNYLSCECMNDATQNALGIYLKALAPGNYAFGGLHYRYDYDYAAEAEALMEIGFDGMKMVENKPPLRKELNRPQNHPSYDGFYRYLEENDIPLLAHVADPEELWDRAAVPDWAYERGWFYGDGGYLPKETLLREMVDVLERFPNMTVILAHLFFLSGDLERLDGVMERFPNILLDIVSGSEMYFNFSKRPQDWRHFFLKHKSRILYGTDNMNLYEEEDIRNADITNRMQMGFLTETGEIPVWDKQIQGIALPEEACSLILRENFLKVAGTPKPLNKAAAVRYLEARLGNERLGLSEEERSVIGEVLQFLQK